MINPALTVVWNGISLFGKVDYQFISLFPCSLRYLLAVLKWWLPKNP